MVNKTKYIAFQHNIFENSFLTTVRIILVRFEHSGQMPFAIAKTAHRAVS